VEVPKSLRKRKGGGSEKKTKHKIGHPPFLQKLCIGFSIEMLFVYPNLLQKLCIGFSIFLKLPFIEVSVNLSGSLGNFGDIQGFLKL
jgi:hypothetical protein